MKKDTFSEVQRFNQWWLWLVLATPSVILVYAIYAQVILGEHFGDNPASNTQLIVFAVGTFLLIALIAFTRLRTQIDASGINMKYLPFAKKTVPWSDVKSATVLDYGFIGGWGVRLWTKYGTVYNTSGKMGMAIELKSGKKFLIGTQKPDELKEVVANLSSRF